MIKYSTLEKNVQEIADKIGKDPRYKDFVKNARFYVMINNKITTGSLANTSWIYKPNPLHLNKGNINFSYERPGGAKKTYKIDSENTWVYKIVVSEVYLKHATWTDLKSTITHELAHDFDYYTFNGKSHGHGKVFVYILNEFRKIVGVRDKKIHGFSSEKTKIGWNKEIHEKRMKIEEKRNQVENNSRKRAALLTEIYDKWYPRAEELGEVNFNNYWDYVKDYIKNHKHKVFKGMRITEINARKWYHFGASVYEAPSGFYVGKTAYQRKQ